MPQAPGPSDRRTRTRPSSRRRRRPPARTRPRGREPVRPKAVSCRHAPSDFDDAAVEPLGGVDVVGCRSLRVPQQPGAAHHHYLGGRPDLGEPLADLAEERLEELAIAERGRRAHAARRPDGPVSRKIASAPRVMFRRRNASGQFASARANIAGVPGGDHGSAGNGTDRVHDGALTPAASASSSATPARMASNAVLVRRGASATASATVSGCSWHQSAKARRRVQSILKRSSPAWTADDSEASVGGASRRTSTVRRNSKPAAARRQHRVPTLGSAWPFSMRVTVVVGTSAFAASARAESPARSRASASSFEGVTTIGVA